MVNSKAPGNSIFKILSQDSVFCALIAFAYIIFIFHITSATGSWVTYSIRNVDNGYMSEIKVGLFNSAVNNSWHLSPYGKCVAAYKAVQLSPVDAANRQMFCDASLANGVLLIISLLLTFGAATLLLAVVTDTILESVVLYIKYICVGIFVLSCKSAEINISFDQHDCDVSGRRDPLQIDGNGL